MRFISGVVAGLMLSAAVPDVKKAEAPKVEDPLFWNVDGKRSCFEVEQKKPDSGLPCPKITLKDATYLVPGALQFTGAANPTGAQVCWCQPGGQQR